MVLIAHLVPGNVRNPVARCPRYRRRLDPRVQKFDPTSFKICHVAGGKFCSERLSDGSDLRIKLADWPSMTVATGRNLRKSLRRVAIEWENLPPKILRKHRLRCCEQPRFASTLWQELDTIEDLRLRNCGDPQPRTWSLLDPSDNLSGRDRAHELGKNICIEQNHSRKVGGFRICSRFGMLSSTPWNAANRLLIDSARPLCSDSTILREVRSTSRASSSIDRPCLAACIRSLALVFSSSLRMVNVGIQQ